MSLLTLTTSLQSHLTTPVTELENVLAIYTDLIECLVEHNHRYYQESDPIISDYEYDQLFDYLKQIESTYPELISPQSPTQSIRGQDVVQDAFEKAEHEHPLLSLENSYDADDIRDRHDRLVRILTKADITTEPRYTIQPKYDGISVALTYTGGTLTQAVTRGDGYIGDDITLNVRTITNLPHTIDYAGDLIIRGEILLPTSELARINSEREAAGEAPFANTRNAASGTIKLLDTSTVRSRRLVCYTYDIMTEIQEGVTLESLGLPTYKDSSFNLQSSSSIEDVIAICLDHTLQHKLESADIDFDGLVIKVIDTQQRDILGSTDHHPRRAIAYKYPAQQVTTSIQSVDYQVGRTGIITPVANLTPVELSGVTISRASLHNFDFISQKDIRLHDHVRIQRSGEVIPYIVRVVTEARTEQSTPITKPTHCPECQHPVFQDDIYLYCPNTHGCPAQMSERIIHYVSKNCMDIEGLGQKYIHILIEHGFIHNIADLYTLHERERDLRALPGFADKRVEQIISEIELSKTKPLRRLLNGLSLPGIGKKLAKEIEKAIQKIPIDSHPGLDQGSLGMMEDSASSAEGQINQKVQILISLLTNSERLTSIYGIGETIVEEMTAFFAQDENIQTLNHLAEYGMSFSPKTKVQRLKTSITGLRFSLTGSLDLPRPQIIEILEGYGAIFDDSPKQSTNIMLIGDKPGSKAQKARDMGLTIFSSLTSLTDHFPDIVFPDTKKEEQAPQQMGLFG